MARRGPAPAAARRPTRGRARPRPAARRCRRRRPAGARGPRRGILQRVVVERRGSAERDACRDARRLVVAAGGERGARAAAQPVEHAREASARCRHGDRAGGQRLVDALVREPRAAVEAPVGRRHGRERAADVDDRCPAGAAARAELDADGRRAGDRGGSERARPGLPVDHEPDAARRARRARAADRPRALATPCADQARRRRRSRRRRSRAAAASRRAGARGRARRARPRPRPIAPDPASAGSASPTASHGAAAKPTRRLRGRRVTARAAGAGPRVAPARCR